MGIPHGSASPPKETTSLLTPLGDACSRLDLTSIHDILEKVGYKDDEDVANEVMYMNTKFLSSSRRSIDHCFICKCSSRSKCGPTRFRRL